MIHYVLSTTASVAVACGIQVSLMFVCHFYSFSVLEMTLHNLSSSTECSSIPFQVPLHMHGFLLSAVVSMPFGLSRYSCFRWTPYDWTRKDVLHSILGKVS